MELTQQQAHARVDAVHRMCLRYPPADLPVTHRFTPGLYAREIFMPAGSLVVSKIHKTEHPFVVLSGAVRVWDAQTGVQELSAGQVGITQPGTRRVLFIREDCRWVTFHPTTKTDVAEIEAEIIEPHVLDMTVTQADELEAELQTLLTGGKTP